MRRFAFGFVLVLFVAYSFAGEFVPVLKSLKKEDKKEQKMVEMVHKDPVVFRVIGKPIEWTTDRLETMEGWSLTGHSWARMNLKDGSVSRIKIGIVNGEWDMEDKWQYDTYRPPHMDEAPQASRGFVFGISFRKEF
jgi:hypothetical protein